MLKTSEEKWRSMIESSSDHIMLLGRDMKILFINKTVAGFNEQDILGRSTNDFIPEEFQALARKKFQEVLQTGEPRNYQTSFLTAGGRTMHFDVRLSPMIKDGKVISVILSTNDVTEQKLVGDALRDLATSMSSLTGDDFFTEVSFHLTKMLEVYYVFVGELSEDPSKVDGIGGYAEGQPMELPVASGHNATAW